MAALLPGCWALVVHSAPGRQGPFWLMQSQMVEASPKEDNSTGRRQQGGDLVLQALTPQSHRSPQWPLFPGDCGPSVLGRRGLVDDDLDDKIFLDLGFLESCAICEQLPREEPSLP